MDNAATTRDETMTKMSADLASSIGKDIAAADCKMGHKPDSLAEVVAELARYCDASTYRMDMRVKAIALNAYRKECETHAEIVRTRI